jgi:1-acyl-sn-glycerol-3-phosphate acyltransferase
VDRAKHNSLVDFTIDLFNRSEQLIVGLTPEGTRKKVDKWKLGFYHIAVGAKLPIILSFMDYTRKEAGVGKILYPSGDLLKDLQIIEDFYKNHQSQKSRLV